MNSLSATMRRRRFLLATLVVLFLLATAAVPLGPSPTSAQQTGPEAAETGGTDSDAGPSGAAADTDSAGQGNATAEGEEETETPTAAAPEVLEEINILELLVKGGYLMFPILAMSLLVVTFGVERLIGLRRSKVMPLELINGLGRLAGEKGGLEPRKAYRLCQQFPSAAATVIKAMLLKVGRPHTELEHAVSEANDREAARLYANVRWLGLAAAVTPLLGLLGTVWGMIQAFFATANLPVGANKAEHLANGIYVALVTTFAGLAVAIPAAILAHFLEGRIQKLFRELDETLMGLMPQLERFEGRMRVSKDHMEASAGNDQPPLRRDKPPAGRAAAATPK